MKILIFGLTISSSWGNGHATIWRGLCKGLIRRGHKVYFFEKNTSYYSDTRDNTYIEGMEIIIYNSWDDIKDKAEKHLKDADAAIVTSYCQDAVNASGLIFNSSVIKIFYDLDTPVTIQNLEKGESLSYIPQEGLCNYDVVLSYTGGKVLNTLQEKLGAKRVFPLYGCVDHETHFPVKPDDNYRSLLSYLGTYSGDRQHKLNEYFIEPAAILNDKKFLLGGSMYPYDIQWPENIYRMEHISPPEHPSFYSSSDYTLNITRAAMADNGFAPSGRLFEAAACGVPLISDYWEGMELFFSPGQEIIIVNTREDVINALQISADERMKIARAAKERTLAEHTCYKRIEDFEKALESLYSLRSTG